VTSPSTPSRSIRVSAAVIVDERGRLLLVRKAGTTAYMQPGGKPEPGETPAETLSRELAEELGVDIAADALRPLGEFTADAANEPGFAVVADVFEADLDGQHPVVAAEIAELRWITREDADVLEVAPLARRYFLPAAAPAPSLTREALGDAWDQGHAAGASDAAGTDTPNPYR
jgi:8-oxo-dGTP diphosphatase